jgi:hypothetical protein
MTVFGKVGDNGYEGKLNQCGKTVRLKVLVGVIEGSL